jgi:hypothetical protein
MERINMKTNRIEEYLIYTTLDMLEKVKVILTDEDVEYERYIFETEGKTINIEYDEKRNRAFFALKKLIKKVYNRDILATDKENLFVILYQDDFFIPFEAFVFNLTDNELIIGKEYQFKLFKNRIDKEIREGYLEGYSPDGRVKIIQ